MRLAKSQSMEVVFIRQLWEHFIGVVASTIFILSDKA
jgi:hypothetical protein